MILSLAPMEGLTGYVFRNVHAECFGALDRYYTPFLTPPKVSYPFNKRDYREVDRSHNQGLPVTPQVLTKNADEFVWASQLLKDMGYEEVNLNLGCPSGTVASKGKGSGFLGKPRELEAFLHDICSSSPLPVSVKTRIGVVDDAEYEQILDMYCRLPLAELIVHPRVQRDLYRGVPRRNTYGDSLAKAPFPVAYNGDIFIPEDASSLESAFPGTRHIMLGRGILANPALARMINGGAPLSAVELERFHDMLLEEYEKAMGGNAVARMKEWWYYAKFSFDDPLAVQRSIRKTRTLEDYRSAASRVFRNEEMVARPRFRPQ